MTGPPLVSQRMTAQHDRHVRSYQSTSNVTVRPVAVGRQQNYVDNQCCFIIEVLLIAEKSLIAEVASADTVLPICMTVIVPKSPSCS